VDCAGARYRWCGFAAFADDPVCVVGGLKSSKRYHRWLRQNRFFGKTVRAWEARLGLTIREKVRLIISATVVIAVSFILCTNIVGRIVLVACWPIPISVALFTKTRKDDQTIPDE